jgi:general L-amino acid transport system substrate-binding protein
VRSRRSRCSAALMALILLGAACAGDDDEGADGTTTTEPSRATLIQEDESVLATVQDRGTLNCGVNEAVAGFGVVDEAGEFSGFDIDFCRVIAAAVLGDAEAVEFMPLTAEQRFTALQSGEIDVLSRNTTWTATRDGGEGAAFVTTTYYDGQGMMARTDAGFDSIDDMGGTTICVLSGTTTELNLATRFNGAGLDFTPLSFEDNDTLREAFINDQCDGWTSDKSQLAAHRSTFPAGEGGPDALVIFEETFSKEPLGPVVRDGDSTWFDAVNWAVLATIQAEEFGITSDNLQEMLESDNADIQRFLGQPAGEDNAVLDPGLDLDTDFVVNVIEQVGNYGEIYDRNVGADSPLELERTQNALWTDGGLIYSPPYR